MADGGRAAGSRASPASTVSDTSPRHCRDARRRRGTAAPVKFDQLTGFPGEGQFAADQRVGHHGQAVNVGAKIDFQPHRLLRGHIRRGSDQASRHRLAAVAAPGPGGWIQRSLRHGNRLRLLGADADQPPLGLLSQIHRHRFPSPETGGRGPDGVAVPGSGAGCGCGSPGSFILATPKSSTLTVYPPRPFGSSQMLSGFRSRCTIPCRCASSSARPTWSRRSATRGSAGRGWVCWKAESVSPSRSSMTRYGTCPLPVVGNSEIGDVDDIRMAQPAARLRFPLEPCQEMRVRRPLGSDHLDRHDPRGSEVRGQVDVSHTARAQLAVEAVFAVKDFVDHGRSGVSAAMITAARGLRAAGDREMRTAAPSKKAHAWVGIRASSCALP